MNISGNVYFVEVRDDGSEKKIYELQKNGNIYTININADNVTLYGRFAVKLNGNSSLYHENLMRKNYQEKYHFRRWDDIENVGIVSALIPDKFVSKLLAGSVNDTCAGKC